MGLGEVGWSWLVYLIVLPVTVVTYARLPAGSTYHFNGTGMVDGGLSRTVTELDYPVAIGAVALALICFARLGGVRAGALALLAVGSCAIAFWPGVVSQADLTARSVNAAPAVGCVVALGLAVAAIRVCGGRMISGRTSWDRVRVLLALAFVLWSIPWIWAAFGSYVSGTPVLGQLFRARQPTPGEPGLASVHLGLHEGLAGTQMVLVALLLSRTLRTLGARPRLRAAVSCYLALLLCYGAVVAANDGWNEQLVKRGLVGFQLPYLLVPSVGPGWAGLLVAALLVHLLWFRREYLGSPITPGLRAAPARS